MKYDAVIVGAGPAGLSTAIELQLKKWRVLVLEKETLPRFKVCGGFVGPENRELLERFGVLSRLYEKGAHDVKRICLSSPSGRSVTLPISFSNNAGGLAVSRQELDNLLLERFQELGGEVLAPAKLVEVKGDQKKHLVIQLASSSHLQMVETNFLIDAMGLRRSGEEQASSFGVSAMFEDVRDMQEDVFLHFINQGHLGINRFENGVTNVCYVAGRSRFTEVQGDLEKLFALFLNENPNIARQLREARRVTPWKGVFVSRPKESTFVRKNALCVGDAVNVINPIAGAGISIALANGALLGNLLATHPQEALSSSTFLTRYEREWNKLFRARIGSSWVWGALGHQPICSNALVGFFSMQKNIFKLLYHFHHKGIKLNELKGCSTV